MRGWRAPFAAFFPGAERGAWFVVLVAAVALIGPALLLDSYEQSAQFGGTVRRSYRAGGVMTLIALGCWAQIVAVAGECVLCRRLFGAANRARMAAVGGFFLLQILAGIGMAWSWAETGNNTLGLFNGTLISTYALCHGAWAAPGRMEQHLALVLGDTPLPFPLLFAAIHLLGGALLLALAGRLRDPASPAPAPSLTDMQGAPPGPMAESTTPVQRG